MFRHWRDRAFRRAYLGSVVIVLLVVVLGPLGERYKWPDWIAYILFFAFVPIWIWYFRQVTRRKGVIKKT
jgi:hypothetical protein